VMLRLFCGVYSHIHSQASSPQCGVSTLDAAGAARTPALFQAYNEHESCGQSVKA
jgi:hypothetical protein